MYPPRAEGVGVTHPLVTLASRHLIVLGSRHQHDFEQVQRVAIHVPVSRLVGAKMRQGGLQIASRLHQQRAPQEVPPVDTFPSTGLEPFVRPIAKLQELQRELVPFLGSRRIGRVPDALLQSARGAIELLHFLEHGGVGRRIVEVGTLRRSLT